MQATTKRARASRPTKPRANVYFVITAALVAFILPKNKDCFECRSGESHNLYCNPQVQCILTAVAYSCVFVANAK